MDSVPLFSGLLDALDCASDGTSFNVDGTLFDIAQGLPLKQDSPASHSSPTGQGLLLAQLLMWSAHEVPQKFVFIVGDLLGGSVGVLVGEDVIGEKLGGGSQSKSW